VCRCETIGPWVHGDDVVAAATEDLDPQLADRSCPDNEDAPARHGVRGTQDAGERFDPDAVELGERVGKWDAVRRA
jgi:hypothetical protein